MSLLQKIRSDLKEAILGKNETKVSVLRFLLSEVLNKEKDVQYHERKRRELKNEEVEQIIFSQVKKRREAMELFKKGKREDLVREETKAIKILETYLPEMLSQEEIEKLAAETIKKVNVVSPKDMGKVMKELMLKIKGRANGKMVSEIVKKLLF